jgi:hypothetical protein
MELPSLVVGRMLPHKFVGITRLLRSFAKRRGGEIFEAASCV